MKEKIEDLIEHYRMRRYEIFEESNELSKMDITKLSKEDKDILKDKLLLLEQEYSLRNNIIFDLQDLL